MITQTPRNQCWADKYIFNMERCFVASVSHEVFDRHESVFVSAMILSADRLCLQLDVAAIGHDVLLA